MVGNIVAIPHIPCLRARNMSRNRWQFHFSRTQLTAPSLELNWDRRSMRIVRSLKPEASFAKRLSADLRPLGDNRRSWPQSGLLDQSRTLDIHPYDKKRGNLSCPLILLQPTHEVRQHNALKDRPLLSDVPGIQDILAMSITGPAHSESRFVHHHQRKSIPALDQIIPSSSPNQPQNTTCARLRARLASEWHYGCIKLAARIWGTVRR
ncbi:hypothetical protein BDZ97DRAFT_602962 [Flammula alnicola]|nr:hypothetical protein BDZ97DRAFT_602962 [Flammula alnicola]